MPTKNGSRRKVRQPKDVASPEDRLFMTAEEVCEQLQITPRTLRNLVLTGRFPAGHHYSARTVRWKRALVESYPEAGPPA